MLMSAFHSAAWLKLISSRRSGAHRNPARLVTPIGSMPGAKSSSRRAGRHAGRATQSRNQRKDDHGNQHFVPAESRFARGMACRPRTALLAKGRAMTHELDALRADGFQVHIFASESVSKVMKHERSDARAA